MKTKIFILITVIASLSACTNKEVVAPTPALSSSGTNVVNQSGSSETPVSITEIPPQEVHGAEVTGKAQDMPEGTKEGEHISDPQEAKTV